MHCVYKITFTEREKNGIFPCYYIGSKSNCKLADGKLFQVYKSGKLKSSPYWGSSRYKDYKKIVESEEKIIEIVKWFDVYSDCLLHEKEQHVENDVVNSTLYFNKSIASENLNNTGLVVCKHKDTGKIIRLPIGHNLLNDGTYVGVNTGRIYTEEMKRKNRRPGDKSFWFGKTRSKDTIDKITATKLEKSVSDPDYYAKITKKNRDRCLGIKIPDERKAKANTFCIHCNKMVIKSAHTRYHGDNCKMKPKDSSKLLDIIE